MNKRAYKYRFFPTEEQRIALARTFGCCRMVFNWGLSERSTAYRERGEKLYYNDLSARLPALKQGRPWLDEVSSVPVQQALRNLDKAFTNFFKGRAKYPKCHQKHHAQAETYTKAAFKLEGTTLRLAKMEAPLAIVWSRPLPERCQVSSITISKDCANRYFVSFLQEETIKPLPVRPQTEEKRGTSMRLLENGIAEDSEPVYASVHAS